MSHIPSIEFGPKFGCFLGVCLFILGPIGVWQSGCFDVGNEAGSRPLASPAASERSAKLDAWTYCEIAVKRQLKSPASAKFPWTNLDTVSTDGAGKFTVTSYVDSQNSFGAMLRANYTCVLKFSNGQWSLENLSIQ